MMTSEQERQPAGAESTQWWLVAQARSANADERRAALQSLLVRNVPSLRLYLTRQLHLAPAVVDDLLQEFVLDKMLTGELMASADRQRGRFRTLLRAALRNFVRDRWRRSNADKRLPDRACPLTDEVIRALSEDRPQRTDLSDVAHAWQVLIESLHRLRAECLAESRPDLWGVFENRVLKPAAGGQAADLVVLAKSFGYASKIQVSNSLVTVQRKLNRVLREVLAQFAPVEEVEAELNDLHQTLSASDAWHSALAELHGARPVDADMGHPSGPYNLAQLSESLLFGATDDPAFGPDVLAENLREILDTPLCQLWNRKRGPNRRANAPQYSETVTVGGLLADPMPPIADLRRLKDFAKHEAVRPERVAPRAICTLLYYVAIITALVRLQEQISGLGHEALLHGIDWLDQQSWLDAATRKQLLDGRKWLGRPEESSPGDAIMHQ